MTLKNKDDLLFEELEAWSRKKTSFSLNDFLNEKEISLHKFEQIASSRKKFTKIWEVVTSQTWENVKNALFTRSLPRAQISHYISESDTFQGQDPDEIMQCLEEGQAKFELYLTAIGDTDLLKKYGRIGINQTEALMKCSLARGMITQKNYDDIIKISEYGESEE